MKIKLSFVHKFIIVCLVVAAIGLFMSPTAYRKEMDIYPDSSISFDYLQEGDYALHVEYSNLDGNNNLLAVSDYVITEDNEPGKVYLDMEVDSDKNYADTTLHLDDDVRGLHIFLDKDEEDSNSITKLTIQSVGLINRDNYFLGMLCIAAAIVTALCGLYCSKSKCIEYSILLCIGLAASLPLMAPYLFFGISGVDLYIHLARIEGIYRGVQNGELPVYINTVMMSGYGNLSASMYPTLFFYPLAILRALGVSLVLCYKVLLTTINIATAFFMYFAVNNICKSQKTAYLATIFYVFSLYRLNDMYYRSALGEAQALTFLPIVLWGTYEVLWGNSKKWYVLALGMSGVIESHVLSVEMSVLFLLIELLCVIFAGKLKTMGKRIIDGLKAVILTCCLNAFFLVPFFYFSQGDLQVFHMNNDVPGSGVFFSQMFAVFSGVKGANINGGTAAGEMPLTIGGVLMAGVGLFIWQCIIKKENNNKMLLGKHCLCLGMLSIYMSSWLFPWSALSRNETASRIISSIQFAWRFLGPATLFMCICSAIGIVEYTENRKERRYITGIIIAATLLSAVYFVDKMCQDVEQVSDKMKFAGADYSDGLYMYMQGDSVMPLNAYYQRNEAVVKTQLGTEMTCTNYTKKGTSISVDVDTTGKIVNGDSVLFPLYYFPGYEVRVDGEKVETYAEDTLVACSIPEGKSHIDVTYEPPYIFKIANAVTLITILSMAVYIILSKKRTKLPQNVRNNFIA